MSAIRAKRIYGVLFQGHDALPKGRGFAQLRERERQKEREEDREVACEAVGTWNAIWSRSVSRTEYIIAPNSMFTDRCLSRIQTVRLGRA